MQFKYCTRTKKYNYAFGHMYILICAGAMYAKIHTNNAGE